MARIQLSPHEIHERAARLTPMQHRVSVCLAEGLGIEEVSTEMHLTPKAVRNHIERIRLKLEVANRYEVMAFVWHLRRVMSDIQGVAR